MRKELHYYHKDAFKAAYEFAQEHKGLIAREHSVDDRSMQGYTCMDDKAENLCWSGELSAIPVENNDGKEIGIFAYWQYNNDNDDE